MSNYLNWYFECPCCGEEVDCHIEENDGPDRFWLTADLPDECPHCSTRLIPHWPLIEEEACEHYSNYHN